MITAAQPARPTLTLPVASLGSRFAAYVLDWLVMFIISCLLLALGGLIVLLSSDMGGRDPSDRALNGALLVASLAAPVWFVMTLAGWLWQGQTIGKMALRLRIVGPDGEPPGLGRALARMALYVIGNLPAAALVPAFVAVALLRRQGDVPTFLALPALALTAPALVSVLLLLFDRQHRALHDWVAGTRVISD